MSKKINTLLFFTLAILSFLFIIPTVSAKTVAKPVKKTIITKKAVVTKKVVKKTTKPTKKVVVKKAATKDIPMSQLPNPNSAGTPAMKLYLQTINNARLTFKKEQASAKTKEAKQVAEEKYSAAVQDAMNLLSASKNNSADSTNSSTNQ